MALDRTNADAVLKDFYLDPARNILNNKVFLLSQIEKNEEDIEGRRAVLSINTARNQGVGARKERENLPTAGQQGWSEERVTLKYLYGRIELSGPVMRSTRSDRGSFVRAIDSETKGVVRDLRSDVNRQLYGVSTGQIVTLAAGASTNTGTVQNSTPTKMRQLQIGMFIDIGTPATPFVRAQNRKITAVNSTAGTFVFDGAAITITVGDMVSRTGSGGTGVDQRELTGLQTQIAATGTLWNIDPTVAPDWASYVDANGGTPRAVAEDMFLKAQQEVNIRSGEEGTLWITSEGVQRKAAALLTGLKQFPTSIKLKGGYSALDMTVPMQGDSGSNEVGLVYDKDNPSPDAFLVTPSRFQFYRMSDWEFMEEDGSMWSRVANQDAYEASLFCYADLATDGRNAHARVTDLIF